MLCVLAFVGFNHAFINGSGTQLFQYCYYDCGSTKNGSWYDKVYRVSPYYSCPSRLVFT